ncbi:MAG: RtcB family protein [Candidatus Omnitrophica bacterium]|nr:RtcB family protein [Candidatus Omnitrophota bacterium]
MSEFWQGTLEKVDDWRYRIPVTYKAGMKVPGILYADETLLKDIVRDKAPEQVANVACLPGIVRHSLAMPDIHWGYGFCIGGVAATDPEAGGVISPGGVGYDINCGVRLMRSEITLAEIKRRIEPLMNRLFTGIPAGVGSKGDIRLSAREERRLFVEGARWAVNKGFGSGEDLECTEAGGALDDADPSQASDRAYERGARQAGTLGSGNHFLEVQVVDEIYDEDIAREFRIFKDQVTVMIHSGSRGFGYQVCDDYVKSMVRAMAKYNIQLSDKQLACAPIKSPEGAAYLGAMRCAANYAWANRQCLMHRTREAFEAVLGASWQSLGLLLVYDVAHNIAKFETYTVDGRRKKLCVHRKGATRAFGPGNPELPARFQRTGQPVIIPGDMGSHSFLLAGTVKAETETFGSTCHGAGRVLSRSASIRACRGRHIDRELLETKGIIVRATGRSTLAEEAPEAYKDVINVVNVVHNAGISKRIARMRPLGVVKG